MSHLTPRVNNAVYNNPPTANGRTADIHITEDGSNFYYAWCAYMGFMGFVFLGWAKSKPRTDRIFFYNAVVIQVITCLAYYAMGSNLGMTPITVEFERVGRKTAGTMREIFWVRYVEWFITTPLIITQLFLTAGVPPPTLILTIFMDEVMIIMGLVGAVTNTGYKWGFFGFGCAAMFFVLWQLFWEGRKYARHLGSDVHRAYLVGLLFVGVTWVAYPICWGVAEGGNIIAPDSEAVYYGILDLVAKPFASIAFLIFHRGIDPARLGLKFRDYDDDIAYHASRQTAHNDAHGPEPKDETAVGEGVRSSTAAPRNSVAADGTNNNNHESSS